ncbi:1033_t:CDS:2 [Ambispora leptoticha]|uniref:1033_t:CDS:1 n=1 Tax=Ambispora leptoticha TaxID=144679 RepID=A0A9N8VJU7_9GLOM|nr:1033_t:CDS:2 [Ambispora leptoticha]
MTSLLSSSSITFPIKTNQTARIINDVHTEVLVTGFNDRIFVILTQYGKVGSLLRTTLDSPLPTTFHSDASSSTTESLPLTTTNFLLGSYSLKYQVYASLITSLIAQDNPKETREIIVGLALLKTQNKIKKSSPNDHTINLNNDGGDDDDDTTIDKELFHEVSAMIRECRVW